MKRLLSIFLLLFSTQVFAVGQVVGPNCLITWEDNPSAQKVTEYLVYWGASPGVYGPPFSVSVSNTTCIDIGVTTAGQYYIALSAVNFVGEGPKSVEIPFEFLGLPGSPTNAALQ